jgi:hypothetical protein
VFFLENTRQRCQPQALHEHGDPRLQQVDLGAGNIALRVEKIQCRALADIAPDTLPGASLAAAARSGARPDRFPSASTLLNQAQSLGLSDARIQVAFENSSNAANAFAEYISDGPPPM